MIQELASQFKSSGRKNLGKHKTGSESEVITGFIAGEAHRGFRLDPRIMYVNGCQVKAAVAVEFSDDDYAKGFGDRVSGSIKEASDAIGAEFIYSLNSGSAADLLGRLGFHSAGSFEKYMRILKWEYRKGRFLPPACITRRLTSSEGYFFRISQGELFTKGKSEYRMTEPEDFDSGFDGLWGDSGRMFSVTGDRSPETLRRRYLASPGKYRILSAFSGNDLQGYIVYYLKDSVAVICDMFFAGENIISYAMADFIKKMRAAGAGSVITCFFGTERVRSRLREFNFFKIRRGAGRLMIWSGNTHLRDLLENPRNWYLTQYDRETVFQK